MRRLLFAALLLAAVVGLTGCAQTGMFAAAQVTSVELGEPNYRVIATNVTGSAEAGYLLGISIPSGMMSTTLALARIEGTGMLYREALAALWANFEAAHGSIAGRRLALVNIRYDADNLNLLLYTRPRLSIRADVVEFAAPEEEGR